MGHPNIPCGTGRALERENEATYPVRVAMAGPGASRRRAQRGREGDIETVALSDIYLPAALAELADQTRLD